MSDDLLKEILKETRSNNSHILNLGKRVSVLENSSKDTPAKRIKLSGPCSPIKTKIFSSSQPIPGPSGLNAKTDNLGSRHDIPCTSGANVRASLDLSLIHI